jgi:hypothetical protein
MRRVRLRPITDRWRLVSAFLAEEASKVVKAAVVFLLSALVVTVAVGVYFGGWALVWDLFEFVGQYVDMML